MERNMQGPQKQEGRQKSELAEVKEHQGLVEWMSLLDSWFFKADLARYSAETKKQYQDTAERHTVTVRK